MVFAFIAAPPLMKRAPQIEQAKAAEPAPVPAPTIDGAVAHRVLPDVPQAALQTIWGTVRVSVKTHVDAEDLEEGREVSRR